MALVLPQAPAPSSVGFFSFYFRCFKEVTRDESLMNKTAMMKVVLSLLCALQESHHFLPIAPRSSECCIKAALAIGWLSDAQFQRLQVHRALEGMADKCSGQ